MHIEEAWMHIEESWMYIQETPMYNVELSIDPRAAGTVQKSV